MNPEDAKRDRKAQEILGKALEMRSPEARAGFLAGACGENAQLRTRVEALLASDVADDFLEKPPVSFDHKTILVAPVTEKPGETIGRYKLLEKVGEGGCGVVYVAEQTEPVRRRVALKIIKAGMDTRQVVARFEAERQALAMMDHPNIAKVLDAGSTDTGRPYFVMELVRGIKITDYCDQNNLSTRQRLDLFIKVCQAVQHAHQKGIIHRDIKPSNILVTVNDGVAVPKVIDFGIAKATEGRLTDATVYTQLHQFIGTPAYMSPEQAEMTSLDIDTRSDIYSLGVLLYELLTGRTPFDPKELMASGIDAMRRTIREQEPERPSTRLATLQGDELTTTAKRRASEAPKLIHLLQGDLDWIVMKTLEKDRTRRYETANGLAADLQRHLNNEPVVARPPSASYRFQKMVRRNKLAFAAAAAVTATLMLGLGISIWQAVRARVAEQEQSRLRSQSQASERAARTEAAKSEQVARFLTDVLEGVGPSVALGRDTTLMREILDKTAKRIDEELGAQPEVEVQLLNTIGIVYWQLGDLPRAETMANAALSRRDQLGGGRHAEVARSLTLKGNVFYDRGEYPEAEAKYREALAIRRELLPEPHPSLVSSVNNMANALGARGDLAGAEALYREAVAMARKLNDGANSLVLALRNLAKNRSAQDDYIEAEALILELLDVLRKEFRYEHPNTADALWLLADLRSNQDNLVEAEELSREALGLYRKLVGEKHPDQVKVLDTLADLRRRRGDLTEAESSYREALAIQRKATGEDSSRFATVLSSLSDVLIRQGKLAEVEELIEDILKTTDDPHARASLLERRGDLRARNGRWSAAARDLALAVELDPENHERYHKLAPVLAQSDDLEGYRRVRREMLARFGGATDPVVAERMAKDCMIIPLNVADLEIVARMADIAVSTGTNHQFITYFQHVKSLAEYRQGRFASAAEWAKKVLGEAGSDILRDVQAYMVTAMAQHRAGHAGEARAALTSGVETAQGKLPKLGSHDFGVGWNDWIIAQALLREAKALVDGAGEDSP